MRKKGTCCLDLESSLSYRCIHTLVAQQETETETGVVGSGGWLLTGVARASHI